MDTVDPQTRSRVMARVKSKDTSPEVFVRGKIHAAGHRYRLHRKDLPGSPDLVFVKYKLVVFVHGCFWHWHGCARSRMPSNNREYWTAKIARNVARDKKNKKLLAAAGWKCHVIWECKLAAGAKRLLGNLARLKAKEEMSAPFHSTKRVMK